METPDGIEVGFHGEYREIEPDERVVSTEIFEGMPEGVPEQAEHGDVHRGERPHDAEILVEHSKKEFRDMHVESGMEDGLQDALDLLEEIATSLG